MPLQHCPIFYIRLLKIKNGIIERGHTSPAGGLNVEECPLLTLKQTWIPFLLTG
jgi:hypothetical protein